MIVPFVGPAYVNRSVNVNDQRCINYYPEVERTGKNIIALYGTPGLTLKATCAAGAEVRGLYWSTRLDFMYIVCGSKLYSCSTAYSLTEKATLNTSTGPIVWAENATQIMFVDGLNGWIITKVTNTAAQITDGDFPATASSCTALDQYFIVIEENNTNVYISALGDGTSWDALDFAVAEAFPDSVTRVIGDHQELWVMGNESIEVWRDTGQPDFPFEPIKSVTLETGIAAKYSAAKLDNSLVWLGGNQQGIGIVWRADGYTPKRISTHAIEYAMQSYSTIADAIGFTQQQDGHSFYWLCFPTANKTWVYDAASSAAADTPMWHERAWTKPADGTFNRHRANCYAFFNGEHIVGDWENGRIYELDYAAYSDNGDALTSLRGSGHIWDKDEQRFLFHHRLQIDIEAGVGLVSGTGSDPQIQLRWSDDGGHNWSSWHYADIGSFAAIGAIGEYKRRAIWNRLGQSRDRIYETQTTDPVKRVIVGANVRVTKGSS